MFLYIIGYETYLLTVSDILTVYVSLDLLPAMRFNNVALFFVSVILRSVIFWSCVFR